MEQKINELNVNGVVYVPKDSVAISAPKIDGMDYCIIRTYSAGVFAGYIQKREGKEATIINSRRIWYWSGANSLSQLAMDGTSKPNDCKFAMEVPKTELTEVIEIIHCSNKSMNSIKGVKEWKM